MPISSTLGMPLPGTPAIDQNLAANTRFKADTDTDKVNLAIGTNVAANGRPWTHATAYPAALTALIEKTTTACGSYTVIAPDMLAKAKIFVCDLLGLSLDVRERTVVSFATGGGSGAVSRAISFIRSQHVGTYDTLVTQADSWPGYASIAYVNGMHFNTCPLDFATLPDGLLIAQTVHNGTGRLLNETVWHALGTRLATADRPVILDLPYAGFDFCDLPYDEALEKSATAVRTLVTTGAPVVVALGPTKIWNTFAYRPGGATVVICRTAEEYAAADARMKRIERGSTGFIDAATHALVRAMADTPDALQNDHAAILTRLAEATHDWRTHAAGTPLATYFSGEFGGLFRIVPVRASAVERLAEQHIHVVDASANGTPRVRINVMGLPHDRAKEIVTAVAAEVV